VAIINANARVKHCEWLGIFKICQFTQQRHVKKGTKLDSFSFILLLSNSSIQDTVKKLTAAVVRGTVENVGIFTYCNRLSSGTKLLV